MILAATHDTRAFSETTEPYSDFFFKIKVKQLSGKVTTHWLWQLPENKKFILKWLKAVGLEIIASRSP
jgi:hypothetical protein